MWSRCCPERAKQNEVHFGGNWFTLTFLCRPCCYFCMGILLICSFLAMSSKYLMQKQPSEMRLDDQVGLSKFHPQHFVCFRIVFTMQWNGSLCKCILRSITGIITTIMKMNELDDGDDAEFGEKGHSATGRLIEVMNISLLLMGTGFKYFWTNSDWLVIYWQLWAASSFKYQISQMEFNWIFRYLNILLHSFPEHVLIAVFSRIYRRK